MKVSANCPTAASGSFSPCVFSLAACLMFSTVCLAAPSIMLSKKMGPPTSWILVSGGGFEPNVGVDIYFDTKDEVLMVTDGFIEEIFTPTAPPQGGIYPSYPYADNFAYNSTPRRDLQDFFCFPPTCQTPPHATFNQINLYANTNVCKKSICQSNACDATCFINYPGSAMDADTY
jgi:hypothetical protein